MCGVVLRHQDSRQHRNQCRSDHCRLHRDCLRPLSAGERDPAPPTEFKELVARQRNPFAEGLSLADARVEQLRRETADDEAMNAAKRKRQEAISDVAEEFGVSSLVVWSSLANNGLISPERFPRAPR